MRSRSSSAIVSARSTSGTGPSVVGAFGPDGSPRPRLLSTRADVDEILVFGTSNAWQQPMVSKVAFKPTDFTPIAAMVQDEFLLWVKQDGPKDVKEYLAAEKAKGSAAKMGGAQSKDTDELLTRMIEKAAGLKFIYIPFKSGAEAAVQLAGGHIDSHVNNPSESVGQWKGGTQRPICVFNTQRLKGPKVTATEGWPDVPTCMESGLDIGLFQQPRTIWLDRKSTRLNSSH